MLFVDENEGRVPVRLNIKTTARWEVTGRPVSECAFVVCIEHTAVMAFNPRTSDAMRVRPWHRTAVVVANKRGTAVLYIRST